MKIYFLTFGLILGGFILNASNTDFIVDKHWKLIDLQLEKVKSPLPIFDFESCELDDYLVFDSTGNCVKYTDEEKCYPEQAAFSILGKWTTKKRGKYIVLNPSTSSEIALKLKVISDNQIQLIAKTDEGTIKIILQEI